MVGDPWLRPLPTGETAAVESPRDRNTQGLKEGTFVGMGQEPHPGGSRVYTWVLQTGNIPPGHDVELIGAPT